MTRQILGSALVVGLGLVFVIAPAHAQSTPYNSQVKTQETQYRAPEDMITMVPFLANIPRTFLLGQGTTMKITPNQLSINHRSHRAHAKAANQACMLGLSYTTPVAGTFSSRLDIPLFQSSTLALSDWSGSSVGDYAAYVSRVPVDHASLKFVLSAKF